MLIEESRVSNLLHNDIHWLVSPALFVCIHLHVVWVDGGVHDDPGPAPQLPVGRQVHEDRLLARYQRINNHGTILEYLAVHVWWEVGGEGRGGGDGEQENEGNIKEGQCRGEGERQQLREIQMQCACGWVTMIKWKGGREGRGNRQPYD